MYTESNSLQDLLSRARKRRHLMLALRGVAICLCVIAAILLLSGWAAHRYRYNPNALLALPPGTTKAALAGGLRGLGRPVCRAFYDPAPWSASIAGAGFEPATFGL